jgi:hypothetical protein
MYLLFYLLTDKKFNIFAEYMIEQVKEQNYGIILCSNFELVYLKLTVLYIVTRTIWSENSGKMWNCSESDSKVTRREEHFQKTKSSRFSLE